VYIWFKGAKCPLFWVHLALYNTMQNNLVLAKGWAVILCGNRNLPLGLALGTCWKPMLQQHCLIQNMEIALPKMHHFIKF